MVDLRSDSPKAVDLEGMLHTVFVVHGYDPYIIHILVGGFEHVHLFSEGLKPPTSTLLIHILSIYYPYTALICCMEPL